MDEVYTFQYIWHHEALPTVYDKSTIGGLEVFLHNIMRLEDCDIAKFLAELDLFGNAWCEIEATELDYAHTFFAMYEP